jgi:hypothetical protein
LNEDAWAEVLKRHPDVLFVIEHTPLIQYTVNAPFDGLGSPLDGTPAVVKATWPEAFKCLTFRVAAHVGQFTRLPGYSPQYSCRCRPG